MFIAHLAAGYLITHRILSTAHRSSGRLLALGLVASIAPDFDLAYYYLVDGRQTLHHKYMAHWPLAWIALSALAAGVAILSNKRAWVLPIGIVLANTMLHLLLDTLTGGIYWLAPFDYTSWHIVTVPARYGWWPANFILHWTFALELLIVSAACLQWKRR